MNSPIFIIAEAGVNHNGKRELAFQLVDAAAEAGANAVKFQTFKAEHLVTKNAEKAEYQKLTTSAKESQYQMIWGLELSFDLHRDLVEYCGAIGVQFLSSAFDFESLDFLANDLNLETLKIPSGEITNAPLLLAHARTGKNLIMSTGMATLGEVKDALSVLAFGMTVNREPLANEFEVAFGSKDGQLKLRERVTLLHCTTEYPAPYGEINLRAMQTMRDNFCLDVGYSDHSEGIVVPIAAAALGVTAIEKHFTLDRELPGPDHKASLEPDELRAMVNGIRTVEEVMGDGRKIPQPSEIDNRRIARKSLVAAKKIKKGERFTRENLAVKRPETGISPMKYWEMLDEESSHSYNVDEVII